MNELISCIKASKHSLSILVCGINGGAIVREAAAKLLGTQILASHSNLLWVDASDSSIGVEKIRELGIFIYGTSYYKDLPKLVVIDEVDSLNIYSLNALLKPLEDLPENTHIILIARNAKSLPSTILSRCIKIKIKPEAKTQSSPGMPDEILPLYEEILMLMRTEKHPSTKIHAFIEKNFALSGEAKMCRLLVGHLLSKAIKFKAGILVQNFSAEESSLIAELASRFSLYSLISLHSEIDARLLATEKFGLDAKSVVLVTLSKLMA